jgi:hypothetical protein
MDANAHELAAKLIKPLIKGVVRRTSSRTWTQ